MIRNFIIIIILWCIIIIIIRAYNNYYTSNREKYEINNSELQKSKCWVSNNEFPEAEKINNAKLKVKQGLLILQKELELNESQLRKVLNDIIENK